jgi:hypothetical protein
LRGGENPVPSSLAGRVRVGFFIMQLHIKLDLRKIIKEGHKDGVCPPSRNLVVVVR